MTVVWAHRMGSAKVGPALFATNTLSALSLLCFVQALRCAHIPPRWTWGASVGRRTRPIVIHLAMEVVACGIGTSVSHRPQGLIEQWQYHVDDPSRWRTGRRHAH